MSLLFVIALSMFSLSNAAISPGTCPEFHSVSDFKMDQYLGRWYEMQHFPNDVEAGDQCITADFGYLTDVKMSLTYGAFDENGLNSTTGTGTLTGIEPGQFLIEFPGVTPDFYSVIGIDYERYSSVYSCREVGSLREEFAFIQMRENLRNETVVNEALAAFTQYGIDVTLFETTLQGTTCPYFPEPEM